MASANLYGLSPVGTTPRSIVSRRLGIGQERLRDHSRPAQPQRGPSRSAALAAHCQQEKPSCSSARDRREETYQVHLIPSSFALGRAPHREVRAIVPASGLALPGAPQTTRHRTSVKIPSNG